MGEVVTKSEYGTPRIGGNATNAKEHLVCQMFTDAVFNQDIRVIQTIITRIDGGLPKDTDVDQFTTLFGDCMNEVLAMTSNLQLKILPTDTVMMALCKSLYDIASADIYHEIKSDKSGNKWAKKVRPSTDKKKERDAAMRLVTERAGGRKTANPAAAPDFAKVSPASWIRGALPSEEERSDG